MDRPTNQGRKGGGCRIYTVCQSWIKSSARTCYAVIRSNEQCFNPMSYVDCGPKYLMRTVDRCLASCTFCRCRWLESRGLSVKCIQTQETGVILCCLLTAQDWDWSSWVPYTYFYADTCSFRPIIMTYLDLICCITSAYHNSPCFYRWDMNLELIIWCIIPHCNWVEKRYPCLRRNLN